MNKVTVLQTYKLVPAEQFDGEGRGRCDGCAFEKDSWQGTCEPVNKLDAEQNGGRGCFNGAGEIWKRVDE